ncbi:hypothetical protein BJF78_04100 [Pseudonocardia sp. CNS-139]|nr:hypothetical protein BJF78_04100 [Pseudonocardia sp. CNS-139]
MLAAGGFAGECAQPGLLHALRGGARQVVEDDDEARHHEPRQLPLRERRDSAGSSGCPSRGTTNALMSCSPHSDGTPTTAASATSGWAESTASTSAEDTFSPRRRIASPARSTK